MAFSTSYADGDPAILVGSLVLWGGMIQYCCPSCGGEHRSRLLALRPAYFRDVIPRLGDVVEPCPITEEWVTVKYENMRWDPGEGAIPVRS